MWLDQNITRKVAFAYEANIFYRIFEETTVGKMSFSVSPAALRLYYKVSKHFIVLFHIKF
jgi:hypothetical protein